MTERPIIFNAEMVRAILDGRKTQTRRIVKLHGDTPKQVTDHGIISYSGTGEQLVRAMTATGAKCPYGQVGDRLWVREAWAIARASMNPDSDIDQLSGIPKTKPDGWGIAYRSTAPTVPVSWRPSIHMPRWGSRITLEITGVRVERVREISDADAKAEGVKAFGGGWKDYLHPGEGMITPHASFATLWNSIYEPRSQGWDANPWVWVIEFKRINKESEVE